MKGIITCKYLGLQGKKVRLTEVDKKKKSGY